MQIQFKNGPGSVIEANALANAYLAGEPAYANNTNSLYIGGVLLSTGATYYIQGAQPSNPANPDSAKAFWFDTDEDFLYIWKYAGGVGEWTRVLASGATGPTGATGAIGSIGSQGIQGTQGVRGATFLSGSTGPVSTTTAIDGDYYLNTTTRLLYGPRATVSGTASWGGAIDLKGETGAQGTTGTQGLIGADGPAGSKIFYGNEVPTSTFPSSTERREGDFYIDLVAGRLYGGFTTSQSWGAGVSLLGPSGVPGPQGDVGSAGLEWKGAWASGTTYPIHSVVQLAGSSYVALKSTTNAPTNASDWELVAAKGTSTSGTATIYANSPIVWDEPSTTLSFSVPNAATGNVLKYDGTSWVAGTSIASKSINSGAGAPSSGDGVEGDFYMQMAGTGAPKLFGPKASGAWGSGVSLVGANGDDGQNGVAGPSGTVGMEWNGEWDPTVNYSKGAVVYYLGSVYICDINNSLNITPNTTANWDLLVAKGVQGDPAILEGTLPVVITTETTGTFPDEVTTLTVSLADGTTTGDVLTWNGVNKAWSAVAPNILLEGLEDVVITSAKSGEVLTYNGTKWENGEITIDSLLDVTTTAPTSGQTLSFNGTFWENSDTVSEVNTTFPLEWDSKTSTVSLTSGTDNNQALLWNKTTNLWEIKTLPAADITANAPLYWDSKDKVISFGVDAQAGNVLMYDGVAWVADTPYDHSRPTILWGDGVPSQGLGRSGDFYIDTTGNYLYGPKCSGCLNNKWTSIQEPVSLIGPTGPTGPVGIQGVQGVQGPTGMTGAQGNSTQNLIRKVDFFGTPMPAPTAYNYLGNNGDFLIINGTESIRWYGPKAAGVWPTPYIELKGTEGPQGVQGIQGIAGPQAGQIIHSATVASNASIPPDPSGSLGDVGDFHITELNTTTGEYIGSYLFGPKTSDGTEPWGIPRNLRGPTGPTGSTGSQGIAGVSPSPALSDIDGGLFNTGTTQDPTLAIKTTTGTGLVLKNIGASLHPHLALDLGALGVFYLDNGNQLRIRPVANNASQRRSFFGI